MFSITLNDGSTIPGLAMGLYLLDDGDDAKNAIKEALSIGYTHFDGAAFYDNERSFAAALAEAGTKRENVFYTTKVWTTDCTHDAAVASIERSVRETGAPVDLTLVHYPKTGCHIEMYRGLQTAYERGLTKRIGLSNYTPEDYEELVASGIMKVHPVVNQIEVSPFIYRKDEVDYFQSRGIVVQAFKPLLRGVGLQDPKLIAMSERLGLSPAVIALKWSKQKGFNVLCKSRSPERLKENYSCLIDDILLSDEDMSLLDSFTTPEALTNIKEHQKKRKNGTSAPWGDGERPYSK